VVPEILFVIGALPPPQQRNASRGKTPTAELNPQLSSEVLPPLQSHRAFALKGF